MNPSPMPPDELRTALAKLSLTQTEAAEVLGVTPRTMRRWASGEIVCSGPAAIVLRLMVEARQDIKQGVRAWMEAQTFEVQPQP